MTAIPPLRVLHELAVGLGDASDPGAAMKLGLEACLQLEGVEAGAAYLFDRTESRLQLIGSIGLSEAFMAARGDFGPDSPEVAMVHVGGSEYYGLETVRTFAGTAISTEGLTTGMVLCLRGAGQVVGTLNVAARSGIEFAEGSRAALESVGAIVGAVVARMRAEADRAEMEATLRSESDLARALSATGSFTDAAGLVLDAVIALEPVCSAALLLLEEGTGDLCLVDSRGIPESALHAVRRFAADSPETRRVREGGVDFQTAADPHHARHSADAAGPIGCMAMLPLTRGGEAMGALIACSVHPSDMRSMVKLALQGLAGTAGGALARLMDEARLAADQAEVTRRAAILAAVAGAGARLMGAADWRDTMDDALRDLGEASGMDRVSVFALEPGAQGAGVGVPRHEWTRAGRRSLMDGPDDAKVIVPLSAMGYWAPLLNAGEPVQALTTDAPIALRAPLEHYGVLSVVIAPIQLEGRLIGFVSMDDCTRGRRWSPSEVDGLRAFAGLISEAERARNDEETRRWNAAVVRAVADSSPVAFVAVDSHADCVLFASAAFYSVWGAEPLRRRAQTGVLSYAEVAAWCADRSASPATFVAMPSTDGDDVVLADGRIVRRASAPMVDADGVRIGTLVLFEDVSGYRRALSEREALSELAQRLTEANTLRDAAVAASTACRRLFSHDALMIARWDEVAGAVVGIYSEDTPLDAVEPVEMEFGMAYSPRGPVSEAIAGRSLLVGAGRDRSAVQTFGAHDRLSETLMYVPIRWRDRVFGTISVQSYAVNRYTAADVATLQTLADQCGPAIARVIAVADLADSRARLQQVVQNMPALLVAIDDRGLPIVWNHEAERVTGYLADEILGNPNVSAMLHVNPDDRIEAEDRWTTDANWRDWQVPMRTRDGRVRTISWSNLTGVYPVPGWAVWGVGVDVTERNELQEQLLQSQKLDSIGRLAGGIAHDFNNLLTAILGYCDIATALLPDAAPAQRPLDNVRKAGLRATELTSQILGFARQQPTSPRAVEADRVVADAATMLRQLVGEHIRFEIALGADGAVVLVDPGQLQQVLVNLAVNARDAMPEGGTLVIATGLDEENDAVQIVVRDTGTGMSEEVARRAFDPFYTTKPKGRGTGLGLATSHGIMTQNGGRLEMETALGEGSTFRMTLPRARVASEGLPGGTDSPAPAGAGETVLVAEDEPLVRDVTVRSLRRAGYRVLEAPGGPQALEIIGLQWAQIDLLVTDVVMPDVSGVMVARAIRGRCPGTPVLFVSGYIANEHLPADTPDAPVGLLAKPYTSTALAEAARALLARRPVGG